MKAKQPYIGMQPLKPEDIANAVLYVVSCPPYVNISEMVIMPTEQASVNLVYRQT